MRYKIIIITVLLALAAQGVTAQRVFTISNISDFSDFLQNIRSSNYNAKDTIKLTTDLQINGSYAVATNGDYPFTGVFDGQGHTIELKFDTVGALFGNIKDATIKNLKVKGIIKKGPIHASGLVGYTVGGTNLITGCRVSTTVHCGYTATHGVRGGGIIGHGMDARNTVRGCVFDGELIADSEGTPKPDDNYCGAIIGWCEHATNQTIENCVEMGKYEGFTHYELIYTNITSFATLNNNYRSHSSANGVDNWQQGKLMYKVKPNMDDYIGLLFGNIKEKFPTSGIQIPSETKGLIVDGILCAAEGEAICFDISPTLKDATYERPNIYGNIISKKDKYYRFNMPSSDWSIGAMVYYKDSLLKGNGTESEPYIISSNLHWNKLCHDVDQGESYSGKYFKLDCDLSTRYMVGNEGKYFSGIFDGNGSERRIKIDIVSQERMTGLFRFIKNADIRRVYISGQMNVTNQLAGGLVACSSGNSRISNCLVKVNINSKYSGNAGHGGIVAATYPDDARLTISACRFEGMFNSINDATKGWGGFVGYRNGTVEVNNSLFAPEYSTQYTRTAFEGSANFVRNSNTSQVSEGNNYYTYALHGNTQGIDASKLNKAYLTTLLGVYNWEQNFTHGGNPTPLMEDRTFKDLYTSEDLQDCYKKTGSYRIHFGTALHNDGMLNTICLPFNMHINHSMFVQGGELYRFYDVVIEGNTTHLVFQRTYDIVAGVPYLIRWTDPHPYFEKDAVWYTGATIKALKPKTVNSLAGYSFCGNFDPIYQNKAAEEGIYVMGDNNTWSPVKATTSETMLLGGFHAYLKLPPTRNAVSFEFIDEANETTAIIPIKIDEAVSTQSDEQTSPQWYTLDGRNLDGKPSQKGIYIYKGKKFVIK